MSLQRIGDNISSSCAAIILAGGQSQRMSFPKPFLILGEKTFLQTLTETFSSAGIRKIIVVLNADYSVESWIKYLDPVLSKIELIRNDQPHRGRFHSIQLGINATIKFPFVFLHNVDNPFIDSDVIQQLWQQRNSVGYTSPVYQKKGGHPILLSSKIMTKINSLSAKEFNLREVMNTFSRVDVEMKDDRVLRNINTVEDYIKYVNR